MDFPHPCSHCGLCCIATVCPVGQDLMRVPKDGPCPALEWDIDHKDESRCGLIRHPERYLPLATLARLNESDLFHALGAGAGCCMAARIIHRGKVTDFAALPSEEKTSLVRRVRDGSIPLLSPGT